MALAAAELLGTVVAPAAPDARRLDRLAVEDTRARLGLPSLAPPLPLSEAGIEPIPGAIEPKEPEVVIDGLSGRELAGEEPPLTAGAEEVKDRVTDGAQRPLPRSPAGFRRWEQRREDRPFGVGQVGRIETRR